MGVCALPGSGDRHAQIPLVRDDHRHVPLNNGDYHWHRSIASVQSRLLLCQLLSWTKLLLQAGLGRLLLINPARLSWRVTAGTAQQGFAHQHRCMEACLRRKLVHQAEQTPYVPC